MANRRLPMRKIKEILRLHFQGIVTLIVLGRKSPHGFPFRRPQSHFPIH